MNNKTRNSLIASIAFGLALAAPAAFAQSQTPPAQDPAATAAPEQAAAPATDAAVGASTQAATPATASGNKQGWEEVDTDKDGTISKDESAANAGLSQVFTQADGDGNGKLTKDEYKAFVEKNYADKSKQD